ncbi:phosphatase PAP2 family protein [Specibacter sp. NPDC057265]|uniref:phosphatase PAP2 family protein n=1 Tax=Specibacter sp. NPDC057265 TaxID=3346075 RepID=UPI00362B5F8D
MNTHATHRTGPHGRPVTRIAAWPFLGAALISLAGLLLSYRFFIGTTTGQYIDESALVEAGAARQRIGTQTSQLLDLLPVTSAVLATLVVLFVTLARRRWKAAGIALAAMAAANLSTQLIKAGLPDRPSLGVNTLALNSLPSGHSTMAASAAAAVFLVVSPRWRPAAAVVGGSYAILAGISTLINQWHRPSDVLAAFFIVTFWTAVAGLYIVRTGTQWNVWLGSAAHWASGRWWSIAAAVLALVSTVAGALVLYAAMSPGAASSTSYLLVGMGLIVAAGYLLALGGIILLTCSVRRRKSR